MLALLRANTLHNSKINSVLQVVRRHAASAAPAEEEESGRGEVLLLLLLLPLAVLAQLFWSSAFVHFAACMLKKHFCASLKCLLQVQTAAAPPGTTSGWLVQQCVTSRACISVAVRMRCN
jgi:hypothetical protein